MTHRLDALTAEYNAWLEKTGLPAMSADDLWFELDAVRNGEKSEYDIDPALATDENQIWLRDFWRRWDVVEGEIQNPKPE